MQFTKSCSPQNQWLNPIPFYFFFSIADRNASMQQLPPRAAAPRILSTFPPQPSPFNPSPHPRISFSFSTHARPYPNLTRLCHSASDPIDEALPEDMAGERAREGGFEIEVGKVDGRKNTRRISARVGIEAQLETVWAVLTNYEGLADFIPGLAVSRLLHYEDKLARIYQVGQQELALGFKFSAKGVIECYEKDMELVSASCRKRAIEFKMVEGDFKTFKGQWCIEQVCDGSDEDSNKSLVEEFGTKLLYNVEVEPKLMVPVQLIERRLCREVEINLLSIREEAQRLQRLQNSTVLC